MESIANGDVVMLRSGGVLMTVLHAGRNDDKELRIKCQWHAEGILQEKEFTDIVLVLVSKST